MFLHSSSPQHLRNILPQPANKINEIIFSRVSVLSPGQTKLFPAIKGAQLLHKRPILRGTTSMIHTNTNTLMKTTTTYTRTNAKQSSSTHTTHTHKWQQHTTTQLQANTQMYTHNKHSPTQNRHKHLRHTRTLITQTSISAHKHTKNISTHTNKKRSSRTHRWGLFLLLLCKSKVNP